MQQLPPRSKLYWRAMVLDQYDGRTWTSNFSNQQPVQAAQLQPEQVDFQYQYIAADPRVTVDYGAGKICTESTGLCIAP